MFFHAHSAGKGAFGCRRPLRTAPRLLRFLIVCLSSPCVGTALAFVVGIGMHYQHRTKFHREACPRMALARFPNANFRRFLSAPRATKKTKTQNESAMMAYETGPAFFHFFV